MLALVVSVLADIFQVYCYYLVFHCLFEKCKLSKKGELIFYAFFFLQTTIPHLVVNVAAITIFFTLTGCIWISFIYEGKVRKKILSGIFAYSIVVLAECLVAAFSGYIHLDFMERETYFSLYGTICLPLVEYLVVRIIKNFKNIRQGEEVSGVYWCITILLPIFSLGLYILFYKQVHWSSIELIIFIILLFVINIFVFFLYDHLSLYFRDKQEKETLALQTKYQMNQIELMHELGESARQQSHDFKKHISMISYLNQKGNQKDIEKYLEEIEDNVQFQQKFVETGNFILDSILNYKIQEAVLEGVRVDSEIALNTDLEISAYDMNGIIANLLDNSIEAVKKTEEKIVMLNIKYLSNKIYIYIENAYEKVMQNDGEYQTTKVDAINHGYGMKIIEDIVKKYNGTMDVLSENNRFIVKICLFL